MNSPDSSRDCSREAHVLKVQGDAHARKNNFDKAIQQYWKAIDLDPTSIAVWNNLGYSYAKSGKDEDAERCREKIRQLKARAADRTNTGPPRRSPSGLPPTLPVNPEREPVSPAEDAGVSAGSLLARLGLRSTRKPAHREKRGQEPHHDQDPVETARGELFWEERKAPSPGVPEQREPGQEPPEPGKPGSLWKRLTHRSKGKGEPADITAPGLTISEPAGSPGASQSSLERSVFFSGLKTPADFGLQETTTSDRLTPPDFGLQETTTSDRPTPPDAGLRETNTSDRPTPPDAGLQETPRGELLWEERKAPTPGVPEQREPGQEPPEPGKPGSLWKRLIHRSKDKGEPADITEPELTINEPAGSPGTSQSSPKRSGFFSRLKTPADAGLQETASSYRPVPSDFGLQESTSPDKSVPPDFGLQETTSPDNPAPPDFGLRETALDALQMEGGEIFHFQGGRSISTIQNSGQLAGGFDRVLDHHPELSAGFRGIALYSLGRFWEALEDFDRELSQDPGSSGIWILRAWVLSRLGRNEEALSSCKQALIIDPENFDAWRQQGFVLQSLGRDQEALHALDRALSLNPHSAEIWVARGRILHAISRDHEALQSYDRALSIDPRSSDLWLARARSLSRLGREEEGIASLEQGIAVNPDNPSLFICQGTLFHVLGKFSEALTAYDRALTIRPDDSRTWEAMGAVLHELGNFRHEAATYNRAIALDPTNISLHEKRGEALSRSGNFVEAARDFRKVLEARPGDMDLVKRLGTTLAAAGMIDEAHEVLRPLLVSSPDGKQMMKARGEALLALGCYREALVAFRETLALYPDDAEVQQGIRNAETALVSVHAESIPTGESPEQGQVTKE